MAFLCDIILQQWFGNTPESPYGGLAQLARAPGSYPVGRWFKSDIRYHKRPVGQAVKTRPFHGCNMGSIPVRVTKNNLNRFFGLGCFYFKTKGLVYGINSLCELHGIAPWGVWHRGLPCIPLFLRS